LAQARAYPHHGPEPHALQHRGRRYDCSRTSTAIPEHRPRSANPRRPTATEGPRRREDELNPTRFHLTGGVQIRLLDGVLRSASVGTPSSAGASIRPPPFFRSPGSVANACARTRGCAPTEPTHPFVAGTSVRMRVPGRRRVSTERTPRTQPGDFVGELQVRRAGGFDANMHSPWLQNPARRRSVHASPDHVRSTVAITAMRPSNTRISCEARLQ
jgi:hypothetical protein